MEKTKVYDLPTRIFHWVFVASFASAFFIVKVFDDESPQYAWHMLLGLTLAFAVGFRVVWGLVGSRYARFSSLPLAPSKLVAYFRNFFSPAARRELGHNPASAWAAIVMMTCGVGLAVTGVLMAQDINKEFFEEVHELLANTFFVTALAHVAGLIVHTIRHRDPIGLSMLHGRKNSVAGEEAQGISRNHALVALAFLASLGGFVFYLNRNYDSGTQTLNFLGTQLSLGEAENEKNESADPDNGHDGDRDDD